MKKNNTAGKSVVQEKAVAKTAAAVGKKPPEEKKPPEGKKPPAAIGIDVGDKTSRYCVLDAAGEITSEGSVGSNRKSMLQKFGDLPRCRMALEVGTHSPWLSRLLKALGFEVIVANARQVQLIAASSRKNDRLDAQLLARLARMDPQLLRPIQHRGEKAQADLLTIRVRADLVKIRTSLINAARGYSKSQGDRIPACGSAAMGMEQLEEFPAELKEGLRPLLEMVEAVTKQIHEMDLKVEELARKEYPETALLRQVSGVGPVIALTFVLTVEDPERFQKSRDVGCYVGLRPKQRDSGKRPATVAHQQRR